MPDIIEPWFEEADYLEMRDHAADHVRLPLGYADWKLKTERKIIELGQAGVNVVKVPVKADDLIQWCLDQGKPIDHHTRREFASALVYRQKDGGAGV